MSHYMLPSCSSQAPRGIQFRPALWRPLALELLARLPLLRKGDSRASLALSLSYDIHEFVPPRVALDVEGAGLHVHQGHAGPEAEYR